MMNSTCDRPSDKLFVNNTCAIFVDSAPNSHEVNSIAVSLVSAESFGRDDLRPSSIDYNSWCHRLLLCPGRQPNDASGGPKRSMRNVYILPFRLRSDLSACVRSESERLESPEIP